MIKINKLESDRPSILFRSGPRKGKDKLVEATKELWETYNQHKVAISSGEKKFKFNSDLYAHKSIKSKLIELQHGKCCFCEAKILHIAYGDVEHFRPKAAYKQESADPFTYPGYFWLAYDWKNLFFSCQLCNQRHKKNLFPLSDLTTRVLNSGDNIDTEEMLFLDPAIDEPRSHITFVQEIPRAITGSTRGMEAIKNLGLDRVQLNEDRRESLLLIMALINVLQVFANKPEYLEDYNLAKVIVKDKIEQCMKSHSEYSSMFIALYEQEIQQILED